MKCGPILIIEDDDSIRNTMKLALELEGYSVQTSANGREGLEVLTKIPKPCLILLDMMMPVMDGWEFAGAIQRHVELSTIPIIVVTAYSENAGALDNVFRVMKKPIDLDLLFQEAMRFCATSAGD